MKYFQRNIEISFELEEKQQNKDWYSFISYNCFDIHFSFNEKIFKDHDYNVNWESVKIFTEHVIENITFLNLKSQKWIEKLYNGKGFKLESVNYFEKDNGYFANVIFAELTKVSYFNPKHCDFEIGLSIRSKTFNEMDCYHQYVALFTTAYGNACFEGVIRKEN